MSSERAGTPTRGTLNREKAFERTERLAKILRKYAAAKIDEDEGGRTVYEADWVEKILQAFVVPDPRIEAVEAYFDRGRDWADDPDVIEANVRAILRGDQ